MIEIAIDYDKLAAAIADRLNEHSETALKNEIEQKEIWDTRDCAKFFKCSYSHFRDRICKAHDFPGAVNGQRLKWFKADIFKWAKKGSQKKR